MQWEVWIPDACCVWALLLLSAVLQEVRSADTVGPVLVHVITEKGRGYLPAETAQVGMMGGALHGPGYVLNIGGLQCAVVVQKAQDGCTAHILIATVCCPCQCGVLINIWRLWFAVSRCSLH